jgi:UDP-N-acetylglucosamine acyltransferase
VSSSAAPRIHPTAIVASGARVGAGTTIGPYCVVGSEVEIGPDCEIGPHVVLDGLTRLGAGNRVFPFASIGAPPQDLKYAGERTRVEVGDRNVLREGVTVHRGTVGGGGLTKIGSDGLYMAYSHVAHDCLIGDYVVMANGSMLAGHVTIEDYAIVGGLVAIHQHARIGESAMLGGGAMVVMDVVPFCIAVGDRARLAGPNVVGLKRRGFEEAAVKRVRQAYRVLFQSKLRLVEAARRLEAEAKNCPLIEKMVRFIERSERGICR